MRRASGLPDGYIPKTIRHTVVKDLRPRGVPAVQISVPLGHRPADMERMTAIYAKYDPRHLADAVAALQALLAEINQNARSWSAGTSRREVRGRARDCRHGVQSRTAVIVNVSPGDSAAIEVSKGLTTLLRRHDAKSAWRFM
jgi:hypothetical protein